eukprot:3506178-Pleurochrysis_carterae.AAC.1
MNDPSAQAQSVFPPAAFAGTPVPGRDDCALAFPSDSVVVHSLAFLPWDVSVTNKALLPGWALSFLLLPVCSLSTDAQTQQLLSSIPV